MDNQAFEFFFQRFTKNGELTEEANDFKIVKKAFFDQYETKEDPAEVIRQAMDASLSAEDLAKTVNMADELYNKAGFNDEAKFGMLRSAVMRIPDLAAFAVYRSAKDYEELKTVIRDFESGLRAFRSANRKGKIAEASSVALPAIGARSTEKHPKLLVRPDARVSNMESKIDSITDQLANLSLLMKKSTSTTRFQDASRGDRSDRVCSYCKKTGHGAAQCAENPNRDKRCRRCGKIGHNEETCWS